MKYSVLYLTIQEPPGQGFPASSTDVVGKSPLVGGGKATVCIAQSVNQASLPSTQ